MRLIPLHKKRTNYWCVFFMCLFFILFKYGLLKGDIRGHFIEFEIVIYVFLCL